VENSEIFSTSLKSSILQDPTVTFVQKCFFLKNLQLVLEMAVLEHFGENVVKNLSGFNHFVNLCSNQQKFVHHFVNFCPNQQKIVKTVVAVSKSTSFY